MRDTGVRMQVRDPVTIERDSLLTKVAVADQRRIGAHAAEIITGSVHGRTRGVPLPNSLRINKPSTTSRRTIFVSTVRRTSPTRR